MARVILTLATLEALDIQVARLLGVVKDPRYSRIVEEHELDLTQCYLFFDISKVLSYILDHYNYEDLHLSFEHLGLEAKKVLAKMEDKFMYVKQLLAQYDILHDNYAVGEVFKDTIEDIQSIYQSVETHLSKILTTQNEIHKMVDNKKMLESKKK